MLSVIVPTIDGREESLQRTLDAYCETLGDVEHEVIVVRNERNWPTGCNRGYEQSTGNVVHFGADDLVPLPGWHEEVLDVLWDEDVLPAAAVYNYLPPPQGQFSNAEDGEDGAYVHFTRVPILTRDQYDRIGPWPEIDYYADIWLSEKARTIGIRTRIYYSYAFVHHWHQTGRLDSKANMDEAGWALNRLREQMV